MKPKPRPQEPARRCAQRYARWLIAQASLACRQLHKRRVSPETLHDFRVTLRRLRTWLAAYEDDAGVSQKSRNRLRTLARLSNTARDDEVLGEWLAAHATAWREHEVSAAAWLKASWRSPSARRREAIHQYLVRHWPKLARRLRRQLARNPPASSEEYCRRIAARDVARHTARLWQYLGRVKTARDSASAHRARISAKRLRYLLEPFQSDSPAIHAVVDDLVVLQDLLGEWRDRELILQTLGLAVERAAAQSMRARFEVAIKSGTPLRSRRSSIDSHPAIAGLPGIARVAAREAQQAYARVRKQCLGTRAETLVRRIRSCARQLAATRKTTRRSDRQT